MLSYIVNLLVNINQILIQVLLAYLRYLMELYLLPISMCHVNYELAI